jgi:hypothetical protein
LIGPSKASISRFIRETTIVLLDVLRHFIKWPNVDGCREIALHFSRMTRYGLPNCVGAIDGTLIPIIAPNSKKFVQNSYWCRHHCYAINALGVCDSKGRFLFLSARFPGIIVNFLIILFNKEKPTMLEFTIKRWPTNSIHLFLGLICLVTQLSGQAKKLSL